MLEVIHLEKSYKTKNGTEEIVLQDLNLQIKDNEFICLLGPSGCGKSTLLKLMAGLEEVTSGEIRLNGLVVNRPQKEYAFVFQDYALFPWKTVLENVEFGMKIKKMYSAKERKEQAISYLKLTHLEKYKDAYIHQLSGGMKQRVAIARSLAVNPEVLFMDEPFGALDNFTRMELQDLLLNIYQSQKMSIVFVTHDIDEAIYLGNKVAIMNSHPGNISALIDIDQSTTKDRTGKSFNNYKEEIFEKFNLIHRQEIEYYI